MCTTCLTQPLQGTSPSSRGDQKNLLLMSCCQLITGSFVSFSAHEFVKRYRNMSTAGHQIPMLASACPGRFHVPFNGFCAKCAHRLPYMCTILSGSDSKHTPFITSHYTMPSSSPFQLLVSFHACCMHINFRAILKNCL